MDAANIPSAKIQNQNNMDAELAKKYEVEIKVLRQIGMDEDEIEDKIIVLDELKGHGPVSARELLEMPESELAKLKSFCWHEGRYRCDTVGISDLSVKGLVVNYSDSNGDPTVYVTSLDQKIDNIGDGEWNYGLYRKVEG